MIDNALNCTNQVINLIVGSTLVEVKFENILSEEMTFIFNHLDYH